MSTQNFGGGRYRFYIYGTTLELGGVPYEAGRLAEDILNMSREKYLARFDTMVEIQKLCDEYEESRDTVVIAQEHITDSIQAILKADYMLALNSGHQIRRCAICERFFLLKSGVHALYCEGACPHAPRFTCRQFGTHEVQKELAKDVPKVRAKLLSFERITKDMRRGNITREEARKAKDYVRDTLYNALRDPNTTLESFEERVSSEHVYSACHIQRAGKPRGRPKKKAEGEA